MKELEILALIFFYFLNGPEAVWRVEFLTLV